MLCCSADVQYDFCLLQWVLVLIHVFIGLHISLVLQNEEVMNNKIIE